MSEDDEPDTSRQRRHSPPPDEFHSRHVFDPSHQNGAVLEPVFSSSALTNQIETTGMEVTSMTTADEVPSFLRASIFQVVMVKTPNRSYTAQQYARGHNNARGNQATNVNYDVAIYVIDVLSTNPSLSVIFHGSNVNPGFFNADYGARSQIMSKLSSFEIDLVTRLLYLTYSIMHYRTWSDVSFTGTQRRWRHGL